jgi:pyrroline-5-carboxylate reductase
MTDRSILLFGGGRMGLAMLKGWVDAGFDAAAIAIVDPAPGPELIAFAEQWGCPLNAPLAPRPGQAIVVAVKPQIVAHLRGAVAAATASDTLLVSIMAGQRLADLGRLFPGVAAFIRAVPNLPAAVGRGMTVAIAGPDCSTAQRAFAEELLAGTGALEWFAEEAAMDAATALSGSGPGYIFYIADCLTRAGVEAGLAPPVAERLARMTLAGAGEMLRVSAKSAAELRRDVTSPAGTTEAGLRVLMADDRLQAMFNATVAAARDRARELAG